MSGHSKWATIRHKKGKLDAKRGKIFTRLIRELSTAAGMGGSDPESNPRLRSAIITAKAANMPNDTIDRAIKKGAGEDEGTSYEEITFEGYGPSGVALIIETITDNRNRTVAEVRHIFDKYNGKLGANGCVSWLFDKRGLITIDKAAVDEDTLMELALETGAEDVNDEGDLWEVITTFEDFLTVKDALDQAGIVTGTAEIVMIPQTTVKLTGKPAASMIRLMDNLEDQDDAQHVWANFDISDEEMETLTA